MFKKDEDIQRAAKGFERLIKDIKDINADLETIDIGKEIYNVIVDKCGLSHNWKR